MKLNHVTLDVTALQRPIDLYRTLGLLPIVHAPPRDARLVCPEGDATLSVEVGRQGALPARAAVLRVRRCRATRPPRGAVARAGLHLHQLPTDMDHLWREARLVDPDGHESRLYHAGGNRLDPPWKLRAGEWLD